MLKSMPSDAELESELMARPEQPKPVPRPRYAISKSDSFKKAREIAVEVEKEEKGWNF